MATKRGRKGTSKAKPKTSAPKATGGARGGPGAPPAPGREVKKAERRPAAREAEPRPAKAGAPARSGDGASPALLARAKILRDAIEQSKLTATDPWSYTSKAREWSRRAQALVDEAARGSAGEPVARQLEALRGEVERDGDFQEAQRRA